MNDQAPPAPPRRYWPLGQLILARVREFYREPEAVFWVYGFPILIVVALGIAFRNTPVEQSNVDVQEGYRAAAAAAALKSDERLVVSVNDEAECRRRLRTGKTDLVVIPAESDKRYTYFYDPTRKEAEVARGRVDDALQHEAGRQDKFTATTRELDEPGSRYVDFLIPGLLGMSLMGGGMFGVGFAIVDLRIRKVLKRFLATPMRKSDFLLGMLISRLVLLAPEVFVL